MVISPSVRCQDLCGGLGEVYLSCGVAIEIQVYRLHGRSSEQHLEDSPARHPPSHDASTCAASRRVASNASRAVDM